MVRAFAVSTESTRVARARGTLIKMGTSVINGHCQHCNKCLTIFDLNVGPFGGNPYRLRHPSAGIR